MCGICGWVPAVGSGTSPESIENYLALACAALEPRGPDGEGRHVEPGVGLGARRLAIIDLETGDQPVTNEDGSVVAVLNGEIYNFADVRRELVAAGHVFKSRVDTEVLPHAYEEWGLEMFGRLDGMFAFAIWDARASRLLLGRDRLGKKPLFYTDLAGGVRFASELKALLADRAIDARPDYRSLWALLALQFIPPGRSPIAGIKSLKPGHYLVFDVPQDRATVRRYWDLYKESSPRGGQPNEIGERLSAAVGARLGADVPLGVFLSGGIDSSLITALVSKKIEGVKTFSVGFDEADYSELPMARRVAEACGTDHTEIVVSWRDASLIPELVYRLDEPLADSSALPTYLVSKAAGSILKVVISGDGGDELFGGYDRYRAFLRIDRLWRPVHTFPSLSTMLGQMLGRVRPDDRAGRARELVRRAGVFLRRGGEPMPDRYLNFLGAFPQAERVGIAGEAFKASNIDIAEPISSILGVRWPLRAADPIASLGALDITAELAGDILVKVDRMSMANSLEVRSPFLDYRFVSWALRLPDSTRMRRGETKPLLRDAVRTYLPPAVASAPKRGFGIPLSLWLQTGLRPLVEDVLRDSRTRERGLISPDAVERLLSEHRAGREHGARIWMLLVLEIWCRSYLDPRAPEPVTLC